MLCQVNKKTHTVYSKLKRVLKQHFLNLYIRAQNETTQRTYRNKNRCNAV